MIILQSIKRFFCAIGRWIRDTAWVQPLLIVGALFGLIFSIPYIVNGVSSWFEGGNASENYYSKFKVSLNGAVNNESDADKLLKYIEDREKNEATQEQINKYGDKFFLCFVQIGCGGCETAQPGFEKLQQNWNTKDYQVEGNFKLYTIFIDEETTDTISEKDKDSFDFFWENHSNFFERSASIAENRPYFDNKGGEGSDYSSLLADIELPDTFKSPTSYLIDFEYIDAEEFGISEVFFTYEGYHGGTTSYDYAYTLRDCWNHKNIFSTDWDKK